MVDPVLLIVYIYISIYMYILYIYNFFLIYFIHFEDFHHASFTYI